VVVHDDERLAGVERGEGVVDALVALGGREVTDVESGLVAAHVSVHSRRRRSVSLPPNLFGVEATRERTVGGV
jgi:hypothetical protein